MFWGDVVYHYEPRDPADIFLLMAVICGVSLLIVIGAAIWQSRKQTERRRRVMGSEPISAEDFLANWRVGKRGSGLGYAAVDQSGCYVILTNPVTRGDGDASYDAVYVGQSIHVCSRVRQHLSGHGNGDVYADVRAGKNVQVRIVPCDERAMNDVERSLIDAFHATKSYNRTRGGSRRR